MPQSIISRPFRRFLLPPGGKVLTAHPSPLPQAAALARSFGELAQGDDAAASSLRRLRPSSSAVRLVDLSSALESGSDSLDPPASDGPAAPRHGSPAGRATGGGAGSSSLSPGAANSQVLVLPPRRSHSARGASPPPPAHASVVSPLVSELQAVLGHWAAAPPAHLPRAGEASGELWARSQPQFPHGPFLRPSLNPLPARSPALPAAEDAGGQLGWLIAVKHLLANIPQGTGAGAPRPLPPSLSPS